MNLNKVMIIGRVTQDPEVRTTPGGQQVSNFSVATNRVWVDKANQKQEKAEFHDVVCWRKLAEITGKYLIKGQEVYVEGRLETRSWEGKDGNKRYRTEIIANVVQLGAKPGGYDSGARKKTQTTSAAPSQPAQSQNTPPPSPADQSSGGKVADKEEEINIEDIPF